MWETCKKRLTSCWMFSNLKHMTRLGEYLYDARAKQKKTLRQVAKEVGASPTLLSFIEHNKHVPNTLLLVRLAEALDCDPDFLCALVGKITPATEDTLASLAKDSPARFRKMINELRS